jgi:hypothetical protein
MGTTPKSQQEFYDLGKTEIQARKDTLTDFSEGSILDIVNGLCSVMAQEVTRLLVDKFKKTYFASSEGQDLEDLAVDHFGDGFARPDATKAVGIVKFSRPTAGAGDVSIEIGTIVKTPTDSNGQSKRFSVKSRVVLTTLSINASVEAVDAGVLGNVGVGEISIIETALTDPTVIVTNESEFSGGEAEQDDATYRQTIENKIQQLKGATLEAIESAALSVPGIESATGIEYKIDVIEYDIATLTTIGDPFKIAKVKLYVADANGEASDALIDLVEEAIASVRGAGVEIEILSAEALELNWTASITLNPAGPNYTLLQTDTTMITDSMSAYLRLLGVGADFIKTDADDAMMAIYGPAGTNDLTDFTTSVPSGDIATSATQKIIPGVMTIE